MASIPITYLASSTYGAPVCPWYDDESLFEFPPATACRLTGGGDKGAECRDDTLSNRVR